MYHPPQIHYRPDPRPSYRQSVVRLSACLYMSLSANGLYVLSCFLAFLIGDGLSECLLGTLSLLTCDYAAGLVLYSLHVLLSMCHFPAFLSLMDPFPPLMVVLSRVP